MEARWTALLRLFQAGRRQTYTARKKEGVCLSTNTFMESGDVLLSRAVSSQVPSALRGLTSVFGMGTGGTLSPLSPEIEFYLILRTLTTAQSELT